MALSEFATIVQSIASEFPLLLLEVTLKVTLLGAAGYLATKLLARRSAAVRHRVWTLVFAALLALPALLFVLPGWRLPISVSYTSPNNTTNGTVALDIAPTAPRSSVAPSLVNGVHAAPGPTQRVTDRDDLPQTATLQDIPAASTDPSLTTVPAVIPPATFSPAAELPSTIPHLAMDTDAGPDVNFGFTWPYLLLSVWIVGMLASVSPLLVGRWRCRRIVHCGREVSDPELHQMLRRLRQQLGVSRVVRVVEVESLSVPALCGVLSCVIVLPTKRDAWTRSFRQQVLLHELAHVRRWDVASSTLARVVAAIYWFHPLVWAALGEMRSLREQACDDAVLSAGTIPHEYAENLLATARASRQRSVTAGEAGLAMATPSTLERRLVAILDETQHRGHVSRRFASLSLAAAVVVAIVFTVPTLRGEVSEPANGDHKSMADRSDDERLDASTPIDERSTEATREEAANVSSGDSAPPDVSTASPLEESVAEPSAEVAGVTEEIKQQLEASGSDRETLRQLRLQLTRIGQYADELSSNGKDNALAQVEEKLQQIRSALESNYQPKPSSDLQLHVVGCYEGVPYSATHEQARVRVTDTSAPLILCLTAHTPTVWHVRVEPGVKLRQVIIGGRDQRVKVEGADVSVADISVADYSYRRGDRFPEALGYAYSRKGDRGAASAFARLAQGLHQLTGMDITTFQGEYRAEKEIIVGPASGDWRREHALPLIRSLYSVATREQRKRALQALRDVVFSFYSTRFGNIDDTPRWVGDHTILGAIRGRVQPVRIGFGRIAIDPRGPVFYADGTKQIDPTTGRVLDFEEHATVAVPNFSHVRGVAFDTQRHRLLVATSGGTGRLYVSDVDNPRWSLLRDMNNVDLLDIVYASQEDVYYGVSGEFLFKYHPDGAILDRLPLKGTTLEPTGYPRQETRLADAGAFLMLAEMVATTQTDQPNQQRRWRVHVLDKKTNKIICSCLMRGLATLSEHQAGIDALVDERIANVRSPGKLAPVPTRINVTAALSEEFGELNVSVIRDPASGHFYELVSGRVGVTWKQALAMAEVRSYQGISGHLVTITSEAENRFLTLNFSNTGTSWAGGSDKDEEGTWKWVCGPEAGQCFWEGNAQTGQARQYAAWTEGEPNDMSGGEHYLAWNWAADEDNLSLWNDWDARRALRAFVVEYSPVATNEGNQ